MSATKSLAELIRELSLEEQKATRQFIESLLTKREQKRGTLRQDWAGVLRAFRQQYTALELQEKLWNG